MLPFSKDKKPAVTIILGKINKKPEAKKPEMEGPEEDNPMAGLDSASEAILAAVESKDPKMLTDALLSFIDQAQMLQLPEEDED